MRLCYKAVADKPGYIEKRRSKSNKQINTGATH